MAKGPGERPVTLNELVAILRALQSGGATTSELTEIFNKLRAEAERLTS